MRNLETILSDQLQELLQTDCKAFLSKRPVKLIVTI